MSDAPRGTGKSIAQAALERTLSKPRELTQQQKDAEVKRCAADFFYFCSRYVKIEDSVTASWVPFVLWPAQQQAAQIVLDSKYTVSLKTRQIGVSWLYGDAIPLWYSLFKPIAEVLMFSQRDDEAIKLLKRLKDSFDLLPEWLRQDVTVSNDHEFKLRNGSYIQALPATTGGRSNAATYCFIDEADFIERLKTLVSFAKPTIDAGLNKMVINSTVNKDTPNSYFQTLYVAARDGQTEWRTNFIPWYAHPARDAIWYDRQRADIMLLEGSLDSLFEQYPATDEEALMTRSLDKRVPPHWLKAVYEKREALDLPLGAPTLPGLSLFALPELGKTYAIGADPAEGLPSSDPSVAQVIDAFTYEQVAVLAGQFEPEAFAGYILKLVEYYNKAPVLPERNNHGNTLISHLKGKVTLREGMDKKIGWHTSLPSKVALWDGAVEVLQRINAEAALSHEDIAPILHDTKTYAEIASIDKDTLKAPEKFHDDRAVAWVLALQCARRGSPSLSQTRYTGLYPSRESGIPGLPPVVPNADIMAQLKAAAYPKAGEQPPALPDDKPQDSRTQQQRYQDMVRWARYGGKKPE